MKEESHIPHKEWVDFEEKIGIWTDKSGRGFDKETTQGIIHYGIDGAHVVPSNPYPTADFIDTAFIRSSIQVALLGSVTPNLRAVFVEYVDNQGRIFFYFDHPPSEEEVELANIVETEFRSDFPLKGYRVDHTIIHLPNPSTLPRQGTLVYSRYEPLLEELAKRHQDPSNNYKSIMSRLLSSLFESLGYSPRQS